MKPSAIYLITWAWSLRRSDCGDNTSPDLRTHLNNTGNMCSVTAAEALDGRLAKLLWSGSRLFN